MIDSHAHLSDPSLADEIAQIMQRAAEAGVEQVVNICTDIPTFERGIEFAKTYPNLHLTAATTPHDVKAEGDELLTMIEGHLDKLVAIGETGLDYYYEHSPRALQQASLHAYLQLAERATLPVVIHCREAFDDFFSIIDTHNVRGVLHCFTGTLEEAKQVIDRGWYLSLSGIVTFKRSDTLREVAAYVPLDQLLIETDAPYLAPQSRRGKQNEPAYLAETAQCIAQARSIDLPTLTTATATNTRTLFNFSRAAGTP